MTDLEDLCFIGILVKDFAKLDDKWRQNESLVEVVVFCCCCTVHRITVSTLYQDTTGTL